MKLINNTGLLIKRLFDPFSELVEKRDEGGIKEYMEEINRIAVARDKDYDNSYKDIQRAEMALRFLKVDEDFDLSSVDGVFELTNKQTGKVIMASRKKRWKVAGRNKWYWFKTEEELVRKYLLDKT